MFKNSTGGLSGLLARVLRTDTSPDGVRYAEKLAAGKGWTGAQIKIERFFVIRMSPKVSKNKGLIAFLPKK